jgi:hypothetical protein
VGGEVKKSRDAGIVSLDDVACVLEAIVVITEDIE